MKSSSYMQADMFGQPLDFIPNPHRYSGTGAIDDPPLNLSKKKRDVPRIRKPPEAPKRFKSSYILFFMAKQKEIKEELGEGASVGDISKRSSEKWKNLSAEERAVWDAKAEADKERYKLEKERYTGPWQVPWKRAKKNPNAPKRPMSAFLFFSQDKRRIIKEANPGMRNTEISRVLGDMWKKATPEERAPHIEREAAEREQYKIDIAKWKEEEEIRRGEMANDDFEPITEVDTSEQKSARVAGKRHHQLSPINYAKSYSPIPLPLPLHHNRDSHSPLPLHHPHPPSPNSSQGYYGNGPHRDYYMAQRFGPPPTQYNPYGAYHHHQQPPPPPQAQNYYQTYAPIPLSHYRPRHYEQYTSAYSTGARSDSAVDDSMHRNIQSYSPEPAQYGNFYAAPAPGYNGDHATSNSDNYHPSK